MKLLTLLGLAILGWSSAASQLPPIDVAPPVIPFPQWTKVSEHDAFTEYSVTFDTPLPSAYPVNNRVPLLVFVPTHATGPVPVVLILHYWGATDLKAEQELAGDLAARGIGGAVMTMPYHLSRAPAGTRSGSMALTADLNRVRAMMTQAVLDARRSIDFLCSRPEFDSRHIGVTGISLGAIVGTTVYGVDPRISAGSFLLGGVDLAKILWNSSRVVPERDILRRNGYTEESLTAELKSVEPLGYLRTRTAGSALIVGAKFDTVVPRASTEELIAAIPKAHTIWLDTGHYGGFLVQARLMSEVGRYFQSAFLATPYSPPRRIFVPTLRIGAQVDTREGFDINVGIDFLKQRNFRSPIGSLLFTPRGPRIFFGEGLDRSLGVGVLVEPKGIRPAVIWSVVL